jgi:hypothetical protein
MEINCHIEGCKKPYRAKGYCDRHYKKWRAGDLPHPRYKTCLQESCRKKRHLSFSLCEEHYNVKIGKSAVEAKAATPAEVKTEEPSAPKVEEKKEEVKAAEEVAK